MKTRLLIIIGIVVMGIVVINFTYGQDIWKEQMGGFDQTSMTNSDVALIPSAKEFLKMDCEDLTHMFPEFPSVEVADAWNTRMHECINAQESLPVQIELERWREISCLGILNNPIPEFENVIVQRAFDIRWNQCLEIMEPEVDGPGIGKGIASEMENLQQMTCDEMVDYNYNRSEGYLSSDNREFARNKVTECIEVQDMLMRNGDCTVIAKMSQQEQEFYVKDTYYDFLTVVNKCLNKEQLDYNKMHVTIQRDLCMDNDGQWINPEEICIISLDK